MKDLLARRVRFIDDAHQRIREDYLRILRFFRFHAFYGDPEMGMDPEALAAIAENASGIETLSNERLGMEMIKLLSAPNPAPAVAAMRASGALGWVFSGADDKALAPLVHAESCLECPRSATSIASLGGRSRGGAAPFQEICAQTSRDEKWCGELGKRRDTWVSKWRRSGGFNRSFTHSYDGIAH